MIKLWYPLKWWNFEIVGDPNDAAILLFKEHLENNFLENTPRIDFLPTREK